MAARIPMIAITTNSSINVNPLFITTPLLSNGVVLSINEEYRAASP
jgi:hypothetical protein